MLYNYFFPEGNKLPFGDEKNKTGRKRSYKAMLYKKREEKIPFGEGKKKRDEGKQYFGSFASVSFASVSSFGRKKNKGRKKKQFPPLGE